MKYCKLSWNKTAQKQRSSFFNSEGIRFLSITSTPVLMMQQNTGAQETEEKETENEIRRASATEWGREKFTKNLKTTHNDTDMSFSLFIVFSGLLYKKWLRTVFRFLWVYENTMARGIFWNFWHRASFSASPVLFLLIDTIFSSFDSVQSLDSSLFCR